MTPCGTWLLLTTKMAPKTTPFESSETVMWNTTARLITTQMPSSGASNNGGSAGRSACITEETALEGFGIKREQLNRDLSCRTEHML
ncbi:hypothetical protein HPB50_001119 [Hyalomma asiaticum]|uniref:Uncharacterized protein n=1 Tax=Hyalomma asiaticum TaxID=266040 RepID=A0ACB7S0Q9_HYAAI|nr:hypothetical protein HPB50_001119 [Hyalomma asiaticum]